VRPGDGGASGLEAVCACGLKTAVASGLEAVARAVWRRRREGRQLREGTRPGAVGRGEAEEEDRN
jgi:hypothetical protein